MITEEFYYSTIFGSYITFAVYLVVRETGLLILVYKQPNNLDMAQNIVLQTNLDEPDFYGRCISILRFRCCVN